MPDLTEFKWIVSDTKILATDDDGNVLGTVAETYNHANAEFIIKLFKNQNKIPEFRLCSQCNKKKRTTNKETPYICVKCEYENLAQNKC